MPLHDHDYMAIARDLAWKGRGQTSPNPMVGAVLVQGGKVVARGWHPYCGGDHAEVMAIKNAQGNTRGATLYVTLEPCSHFGRTPPCVNAILQAGIQEVVVGMKDPNPVNNGKSLHLLKKAGVRVKAGFLEEELHRMNEAFITYMVERRPLVTAKCAQTLDGKIAARTGDSKWITSEDSRAYAHELRFNFDGIIVGINTVLKDNPFLQAPGKRRPIRKIILDSRARLPLNAHVFQKTDAQDVLLITTPLAVPSRLKALHTRGVSILVSPRRSLVISWPWLLKELAKREMTSVLIEGGAHTVGGALAAGCVDKVWIFIAPKIMGDEQALSAIVGRKVSSIKQAIQLQNLTVGSIKDDLFIEGYVHRNC